MGIALVAIAPGLWMGNLEHLAIIFNATLLFLPAWAGAMYWVVRAVRAHRAGRSDQAALYGLVCAASMLPLLVIYAYLLPLPPSIIARTRAPDGTELCLTQAYSDFYQISLYCRRPGQPWRWFYYDHEDTRWWRGAIELSADGNIARVKRGPREMARFDLASQTFTIVNRSRTTTGAPRWMPEGWTPDYSVAHGGTMEYPEASSLRRKSQQNR